MSICASQNPGEQQEPTRFTDMRHCDDPKIRCWHDTNSIKNAVQKITSIYKIKLLVKLQIYKEKLSRIRPYFYLRDKANLQIDQFRREVAFIIAPDYKGSDDVNVMKSAVDSEIKRKLMVHLEKSSEMLFSIIIKHLCFNESTIKECLFSCLLKIGKKKTLLKNCNNSPIINYVICNRRNFETIPRS